MAHTVIVAFAGPSGAGKTELTRRLMAAYPNYCTRWHQVTTRARRSLDDDYVFISPETYAQVRDALTCRTEFNGQYYGTIPETGAEGKVMLTVVDINGLHDLENDVRSHNATLHEIAEGQVGRVAPKFGSLSVKLLKVLVSYKLTDESVAERGRASRGLDFVAAELNGLMQVSFDKRINTTGRQWPDPIRFFEDAIWPALHLPILSDKQTRAITEIETLLPKVNPDVAHGLQGELDRIRGMGNLPPCPENRSAAHEREYGPDATTVDKPATDSSFTDEPTLREHVKADFETGVAEADIDEPVATLQFSSLKQLASEVDFVNWLLTHGIGIRAFESEAEFGSTVSQYLTEHSVSGAGTLTIISQATKDAKGGRVVEYVAIAPSGERLSVEFNERLRRIVALRLQ